MLYYQNFSRGAWLYLSLHGTYGIIWILKDIIFPDKTFQVKVSLIGCSCVSIVLLLYCYNHVLYYSDDMNIIVLYGWSFIAWYCLCLIAKHYLDISDIILFVFIGWLVIGSFLYILEKYRIEYYLTEANVLEAKNLKEVEMFSKNLLKIVSNNSIQAKTLLRGLTYSLVDFFENNSELYEKYEKFSTNKMMIQKLGGPENPIFEVYNIIYLIYDYYLNRSHLKDDILLVLCYFLINKYIFLCLY